MYTHESVKDQHDEAIVEWSKNLNQRALRTAEQALQAKSSPRKLVAKR